MHLLSRRLSDSFINQASDILSHLSMASLGFITPIKPSYPRGVKRSLRSKFSIKADALTCNVISIYWKLQMLIVRQMVSDIGLIPAFRQNSQKWYKFTHNVMFTYLGSEIEHVFRITSCGKFVPLGLASNLYNGRKLLRTVLY